ncbi:MAG: AAA family ATPase [Candidatus Gastranaerophilales bacterium]|nr:AAA family ATPase [Candidatus Gastranaerophilales bacterium]
MRLISLELENFRQHASTKLEFTDGITIINGANGTGKSTILEAISWAIYGTEAVRGNKDSIKWNKAPARSKVKVELIFALENEVFRVIRELNKAEVYLEGNESPLAVSQDEVTKYLTDKLGMNRTEFFNTYFTGQKELNFLSGKGTIERRKFISKVLNYDKVREAQDKVRVDKNNITNEILGMKQGLTDIEVLEEEKKQISDKLISVTKIFQEKQEEFNKHAMELGKLHPDWAKIKSVKDDYGKLSTELKYTCGRLEDTEKNILSLKTEYDSLESKSKKLLDLEKHLVEYKKIETQIIEQEKLQHHEMKKQKLLMKFENFTQEVLNLEKKLDEIQSSANAGKKALTNTDSLKKEIDDIKNKIQNDWTAWTSSMQEIKALRKQKEQELNKTANQFSIIEQKGENGACPTCERALKGEFEKVIGNLKSHIEILSREIQGLIEKEEDLRIEPVQIKENKKLLEEKEKEYEKLAKIQGKLEEELKLYENIKVEVAKKKEFRFEAEESIKKIPEGFNGEFLQKLKEDFKALKKIYEEILGLKAQVLNKDKIKDSLELALKNKSDQESGKKQLESNINKLNFSEEAYKKLEEQVINIEKAYNSAKLETTKAEGDLKQIKAILDRILETEKGYKEKIELIKTRQDKLNHLIELDRFYGQFLEKLNNLARPEISELAGRFLAELTDGRYSILELNEKYEICLYDDGEIKPVISGGEEDIANLCIRLALSQMIAQRSGRGLSLLILDEVFGSLDENRRNNVISLLNSLTNSFDQVILITHIDDIKDGIDNIIKVEYDEERGCSVVSVPDSCSKSVNIEELSLF